MSRASIHSGRGLPTGTSVWSGYDAASRLTGLTYRQGGTTLGTVTYQYDAAGNRVQQGGNLARTAYPPVLTAATYNANNQQTTFGANTETYDLNGNLATISDVSGTATYTWNVRNQLVGIAATGFAASFTYDAFGRRTGKTVQGVTTNYVYDGLTPVQEKAGATVTATLLTGLGIDEFYTRTDGTGTRALLPDALGFTTALSDNAGNLQTQYTYEPFGYVSQTGQANGNSYKFTGREDDGTGLSYYRARYYQPRLQRFVSEDPIEFEGGWNLYSYVGSSPLNFVDSLGYAKGGKQNISVNTPDGKTYTKQSPLQQIREALERARELGWSKGTIKALLALEKVVKRGGTMTVVLDLLRPDSANAGENDLLCGQGIPTSSCMPQSQNHSKSSQ